MFLGIDIGSSSSKAVILSPEGKILAEEVVNIGTGTKGVDRVLASCYEKSGLSQKDILYSVVTGYGRMTYQGADEQITEISCHAKGVFFEFPDARSIIDIGGQDAKVIRLGLDGKVENFQMNEKCAAGTGRFFEVMARVLDCSLGELSSLAEKPAQPVHISSVCTVFAESEVISHLASGADHSSVAKGVNQSVAKRIVGLCSRVGLQPKVVMTGGVALNASMVKALEEEIYQSITIPRSPQTMGALGAAVFAHDRYLNTHEIVTRKKE
jgi:predicted CoA-substrate-specific enzyme activase